MPNYRVLVESSVSAQTWVNIEAEDEADAEDKAATEAEKGIRSGDLDWEFGSVHPDDSVDVVEVEEV